MAETHAIKWLRARGVDFEIHLYDFERVGAERAAAAVNQPLEATCKTLVVELAGQKYFTAILPGDQRIDLKKLAAFFGAPRADLADRDRAEKLTGYQVGGISPFAQRRPLPVVIEASLQALDRVLVNGGRRGVLVELDTERLIALLAARTADICR